jgi:hypothetical protein
MPHEHACDALNLTGVDQLDHAPMAAFALPERLSLVRWIYPGSTAVQRRYALRADELES